MSSNYTGLGRYEQLFDQLDVAISMLESRCDKIERRVTNSQASKATYTQKPDACYNPRRKLRTRPLPEPPPRRYYSLPCWDPPGHRQQFVQAAYELLPSRRRSHHPSSRNPTRFPPYEQPEPYRRQYNTCAYNQPTCREMQGQRTFHGSSAYDQSSPSCLDPPRRWQPLREPATPYEAPTCEPPTCWDYRVQQGCQEYEKQHPTSGPLELNDPVSDFATFGDGESDSVFYPDYYWDSDEYEGEKRPCHYRRHSNERDEKLFDLNGLLRQKDGDFAPEHKRTELLTFNITNRENEIHKKFSGLLEKEETAEPLRSSLETTDHDFGVLTIGKRESMEFRCLVDEHTDGFEIQKQDNQLEREEKQRLFEYESKLKSKELGKKVGAHTLQTLCVYVDLNVMITNMNPRLPSLDTDARLIPPRNDTPCLSILRGVNKLFVLAWNFADNIGPPLLNFDGADRGRRSTVRCVFDPGGDASPKLFAFNSRLCFVVFTLRTRWISTVGELIRSYP